MSNFYQNRGSDLEFYLNWPDGAGGYADLTGWTVTAFEADAEFVPNLTVSLVDPATGLISARVEWDDSFEPKRSYVFRIQIINGNEHQATNALTVVYQ